MTRLEWHAAIHNNCSRHSLFIRDSRLLYYKRNRNSGQPDKNHAVHLKSNMKADMFMVDVSDRRSFMRRVAGLAALGALGAVALERLPVPVSAATAGDVAFSDGTTNGVTFDHPNFFWNSTNHRLGIGTATPSDLLTVSDGTSEFVIFRKAQRDIVGRLNDNLDFAVQGNNNNGISFAKTPGNTSLSQNTFIRFAQCGSIDAWSPFWNGVQFVGHQITESGNVYYPILTYYSRSQTATDPTDYQWVFGPGNTLNTAQSFKFVSLITSTQTGESQGDIRFSTSVDPAMVITRSGKVGIGTTSPSQPLTVAGDVGQSVVSANGIIKAAVLVNGGTPSIIRSFNNLPGGSGPTVSQPLGPGTYDVNFGVNVAQRFFLATLLSSNATDAGGASDGQVLASTSDRSANAVFVRTNDTTGTSANRSFYLMIF